MTTTTTTPHGIPTFFDGIEYRSRLEAKWAAFFTRIGWQHTYEPFDGVGYIPDFLVHGGRPLLVEVKPAVNQAELSAPIQKVTTGLTGVWNHDILIVGAAPRPLMDNNWDWEHPAAGLLGELFTIEDGTDTWEFGAANWALCRKCKGFSLFHDYQSYACRPCGDYDGDGYLGQIGRAALDQHWADATNDVKWRGRAA